jgi:hypothetical protein
MDSSTTPTPLTLRWRLVLSASSWTRSTRWKKSSSTRTGATVPFLVKDPDWASEHEYRWGLVTAATGSDATSSHDELLVRAGDAIVGLVLGLRADDTDPAVEAFVSRFGITANLAKARWRENRLDLDLPILP